MLAIGPYHLHSLKVQEFLFDGISPASDGSRPVRPGLRTRLVTRLLLIIGNSRTILVDAGVGRPCAASRWAANATTHYRLPEELAKFGLHPGEITDLVLTHLHRDHAGGAFTCAEDRLLPVFPNATVIVQEENLRSACRPDSRERGSIDEALVEELQQMPLLRTVSGNREIFEGIDVIVSNGHTRGQQLVRVSDGRTTLLHGGDLIPTTAHYPAARVTGNDIDPRTVIEEKSAILDEACREGWILFFGHDPLRHAATVLQGSSGFVPGPAPAF
jgi:glyoxylase-like metal-dependent hydrolase (beta-lactamase superfamily II)